MTLFSAFVPDREKTRGLSGGTSQATLGTL